MTMEFGNLLRGELQGATNARLGEFHLALSARDGDGTNEGDQNRWKKFSPGDSKLSVVAES